MTSSRCFYIAQTYSVLKKYGESLALTSRANLYLRETRSNLQPLPDSSPNDHANLGFYPLVLDSVEQLERTISADELKLKHDWFTFNGGAVSSDAGVHKKPLFFDIAFNYVEVPTDRLQVRAGKAPVAPAPQPTPAPASASAAALAAPVDKKTSKAAVEKEPAPAPAPSGGLSSLLGGWWGRK